VKNTQHSSHTDSQEEHGHADFEPITIKRIVMHERIAQEMKKSGIDCDALTLGSHQLERHEAYYSHEFALTSRLVTNRGLIEIRGKNVDFVQILQRI
jgi:hypothetical protein